MKITTEGQINELESLIGQENAEASRRLLTEGGELWVFRTVEELEADSDLSEQIKIQCKKEFAETDGKYAGWYRLPENQKNFSLGFTSSLGSDQVRFVSTNSGEQWSH